IKETGRIFDHQMDFQRKPRSRPQALHNAGAHAEIGYEMAIHHINMDTMRAGALHLGHFLAEAAKIGCQDRRCDVDHSGTAKSLSEKGSGTVAGTARRVLCTTVPDPFSERL